MRGNANPSRESRVMPQCKMICRAFAVLALLSVSTFGSAGQTSVATIAMPPQYSPGPTTDYTAALPNSTDVLRFRRGERYNISNPSLPELGENSQTLWDLPETHFKKSPMPFDTSDAVVVGTVTAGQAYLSNDKRNIYSEFKLKLLETIKTPNAPYLHAGDAIDIQRKGGAIRLPSGKVVVRAALTDSMPQVGKRYLLFLKYDQGAEDYAVLTGYLLDGNEVYCMDDLSYSESNHEEVMHSLRKKGVSEEQFLVCARSTRKSGAS